MAAGEVVVAVSMDMGCALLEGSGGWKLLAHTTT
jgi:hypothetical protein